MALRMDCICGQYLSNSEAPNDIQLRVYTDREWDAILSVDIIETWKIPLPTCDVWKCPSCERVYVFKFEGGKHKFTKIYRLEDEVLFSDSTG